VAVMPHTTLGVGTPLIARLL